MTISPAISTVAANDVCRAILIVWARKPLFMLGFRLSFTRLTLPFLLRTECADLPSFAVIFTNGGRGHNTDEPYVNYLLKLLYMIPRNSLAIRKKLRRRYNLKSLD